MYHCGMGRAITGKTKSTDQRSYDLNCPIAMSLDLVGDRWTLLILRDLFISPTCRYVELRESLTGISPTLLSQRIKDLTRNGLIEQTERRESGHVAYRLTARGRETKPILVALARFGLPHVDGRAPDKAWQAFTRN